MHSTQSEIKVERLNESFSELSGDKESLVNIFNYLKAIESETYDRRIGRYIKKYRHFTKAIPGTSKLLVANGHLHFLKSFGVEPYTEESEFEPSVIKRDISDIVSLMPFSPYDYQLRCAVESLQNPKQINRACTGAGKSAIIFLMLMFLYKQNKKGLLIVPNINLLTQLRQDFEDYFKEDSDYKREFMSNIETLGGGFKANFDKFLVISTWQSLANNREYLDKTDFIICDELHRYASEITSDIIKSTSNAKYKWGLTGTLPEAEVDKMELFGMFGLPKTYITSKDLIDRGLATPIKINSLIFNYSANDKNLFSKLKNYQKQLAFIKEHESRTKFIVDLTCKIKDTGNTLVLFSHTEQGKTIFLDVMKKLYPNVEVENKNITGKKSFEFQEQYGVYFVNGEDDAKTREQTRKILEEHKNAILISNYQLLSTGVNIKALYNMVLASPLRAYTTITQSVGRLMRLHPDKKIANVYDIIDNFGIRKPSGVFWKQYEHRKNMSYNPEEFPIVERFIDLN